MIKLSSRIVAVLLVPCLSMDPVLAALSGPVLLPQASSNPAPSFERQAIVSRLAAASFFAKTLNPRISAHIKLFHQITAFLRRNGSEAIPLPLEETEPDWQSSGWLNEAPHLTGSEAFAYADERAKKDGLRPVSEEDVRAIAQAAFRLAAYIHRGRFDRLMFSSRSSYFSYALLSAAWKKIYPKERLPKIVYFNHEANRILYKYEYASPSEATLARRHFFSTTGLIALTDKKMCFVDDVIATGSKHDELTQTYQTAGFESMYYAVLGISKPAQARNRRVPMNPYLFTAVINGALYNKIHRLSIALSHGNRGVKS
jgi:hypothetical protein